MFIDTAFRMTSKSCSDNEVTDPNVKMMSTVIIIHAISWKQRYVHTWLSKSPPFWSFFKVKIIIWTCLVPPYYPLQNSKRLNETAGLHADAHLDGLSTHTHTAVWDKHFVSKWKMEDRRHKEYLPCDYYYKIHDVPHISQIRSFVKNEA